MLFDSASTHNVINSKLIKRLKLKTSPSDYAYTVKMADGSSIEVWDRRVTQLELGIHDYVEKLDFELTRLAHTDIALGMAWHFWKNPAIDWKRHIYQFKMNGVDYVLRGEKNLPRVCV